MPRTSFKIRLRDVETRPAKARPVTGGSRARAALPRPVPPVVVERVVGPRRACDTGWRLRPWRRPRRGWQLGLGRARQWQARGRPGARIRCGAGPPMMSRRRMRQAVRHGGGEGGRGGALRHLGWQGPRRVGTGRRMGAEHSGVTAVTTMIPERQFINGCRTAPRRRWMGRGRRRDCRRQSVRGFPRG